METIKTDMLTMLLVALAPTLFFTGIAAQIAAFRLRRGGRGVLGLAMSAVGVLFGYLLLSDRVRDLPPSLERFLNFVLGIALLCVGIVFTVRALRRAEMGRALRWLFQCVFMGYYAAVQEVPQVYDHMDSWLKDALFFLFFLSLCLTVVWDFLDSHRKARPKQKHQGD